MIKILRHFEGSEIRNGMLGSVPHYHGLVWGSGQEDPEVWSLLEAFLKDEWKDFWLYTQYLTHPEPDWVDKGQIWFDFVAKTLPKLESPDGRDAVAWAKSRPMIDFHLLDTGKLRGLWATLMIRTRQFTVHAGETRIVPKNFLDLAFKRPRDWMFLPAGPAYNDFPADWWVHWERRFMRSLKNQFEPMLNGDWSIEGYPLYLEHSQVDWERAFSKWTAHNDAVLSCLADDRDAVSYMIKRVKEANDSFDRWIAFTSHSDTAREEAYEKAAEEFEE